MKLAFTTLGCPQWGLDAIVARAVEYGYDGVDLRGVDGEMDIFKLPAFRENAAATAARFAQAGLAVPCFSSSARVYADPDGAVAQVERYAPLCRVFGAAYLRVFCGALAPAADVAGAVALAADTLRRCLPVAREHGVVLLVETHDDWLGDLLVKLMEAVPDPQVGVLWDVHHPYRQGGIEPEQTWADLGRRIAYTHFKDSRLVPDGKPTACRLTLTGQGDIPLPRILATLKKGGYDGWLTYEWEKVWHPEIEEPEVAFPQFVEYMRAAGVEAETAP
jgi:sugar phosphate isomerase/epimerase